MKPMLALATLFAVALPSVPALAATPTGDGGGVRDGEVRAVSVRAASGNVEVVIDLQGAIDVQDFTLNGPARLVLDLVGARLTGPAALYDGQNRGGIRNIRYAQFKPDVVRVVIDLDVLKDYKVQRGAGQVRVSLGTERTGFASWSSLTAANLAAAAASGPPPAPPTSAAGRIRRRASARPPSGAR